MIHASTPITALALLFAGFGMDYRFYSMPITPVQNLNFRWLNQRQLRKNKRRKHAARFKKAFK